ncbi:MAG: alpha/beta fold hydrolase [Nanoarchaeota archaeon]|nr:alpha/beta fold hydrolase [Nanoarchaeota archaeon]
MKIKNKKRLVVLILVVLLIIPVSISIFSRFEKPYVKYENSIDLGDDSIKLGNEAFFIDNNSSKAVLLVHGLSPSPHQTTNLSDYLSEKGITVSSIRLSGHGTNVYNLEKQDWQDWCNDVDKEYDRLKERHEKVFIIGISLGAGCALYSAENKDIAGIVAVAPPIYFVNKKARFSFILKLFKRWEYIGIEKENVGYHYENIPSRSIAELIELMSTVKRSLYRVEEPILIIHSLNDELVRAESSRYVLNNIKSLDKDILWVNSSKHSVIRYDEDDSEKDRKDVDNVFSYVHNFIGKH